MTPRLRDVLAATAAVAAACGVLAACDDGTTSPASPVSSPASSSPAQVSSPASAQPSASVPLSDRPAPGPAATPAAGTRPVRVQIPSIGVDSTLESLRATASGVLATPSRWQRAGWYADGVRPGDIGPAVIAGHVDSRNGPAVFFRLDRLGRGDHVVVTRADGRRLTFVVDGVREYPKRTFPTDAVYGPTSLSVLRLITCAGDFDRGARSYVDNLVVTSHLETL